MIKKPIVKQPSKIKKDLATYDKFKTINKSQPINIPKKKISYNDMCNPETSNHPYAHQM
jgi:hypothetical protein